jgi:hypothetical protein
VRTGAQALADQDWKAIAEKLYLTLNAFGCTCEFERNKSGVPLWFPMEGGGIGRKLLKRCSKHQACNEYELAAGLELTGP